MPTKRFNKRPSRKRFHKNAVKKKYHIDNMGSEGCTSGTIFLTEEEAELINKVSNPKNWDTIECDDCYDGRTFVWLDEED